MIDRIKKKSKKVCVCLPSYNEAENIEFITTKVDKALKKLKNEYECIIVNADNNSVDGTNKIFQKKNKEVKKDGNEYKI